MSWIRKEEGGVRDGPSACIERKYTATEKMGTEVGKEAGTPTGRALLKREGKEGLSITAASQWLTGAGATQLTQAVYVWGGAEQCKAKCWLAGAAE